MKKAFQLTVSSGIGRLIFDLKDQSVNLLSPPIINELESIIDELEKRDDIQVLLIQSGKKLSFIAGADLHVFQPAFKDPKLVKKIIQKGHTLLKKLENLPFPTIAIIHGACLGGGLELALACNYRIVSDHPQTLLGLPEVNLGLFPGWGGTIRLPKLIGLIRSLPIILSGKPVSAIKAWKIKLADAIFPWEFLQEKIEPFIQSCLSPKGKNAILKKRKRHTLRSFLLEKNPIGRLFLFWTTKNELLKKTKGHYPAHLAVLQLIQKSYPLPLNLGLKKEIEAFVQSIPQTFSNSKNLIQLFFTRESLKKEAKKFQSNVPIESLGIIGAGTMGSGIAWVFSHGGYPVRLKDIDWKDIGKGYANIWKIYKKLMEIKKLSPSDASLQFHQISTTLDYTGFKKLDLILEAIPEELSLKKNTFQQLEEIVSKETLIASNTSSLTITELSKEMNNPERLIGMHFFNPAHRMPLVEVVPGKLTSEKSIAKAMELCLKLGKIPLLVKDSPGFLVNRILSPTLLELMHMLQEGVEITKLDRTILDFGFPMEPLLLADHLGNDINLKALTSFEQAFGERMQVPTILKKMVAQNLLGCKTKKGFYLDHTNKKKPNPDIKKLLDCPPKPIDQKEIIQRALLVMVNEAARCLQEDIVSSPEYLDMALILGLGFPPFRGGILRYADQQGISQVVKRLDQLAKEHGPRFIPCQLLQEMEKTGKQFYES